MSKMRGRRSSKTDLEFQHLGWNQNSIRRAHLISWILLVERVKSIHWHSKPEIQPLKEVPLIQQGHFNMRLFQTASLRVLCRLFDLPWTSVLHAVLI